MRDLLFVPRFDRLLKVYGLVPPSTLGGEKAKNVGMDEESF
jgi:hypothetical protein